MPCIHALGWPHMTQCRSLSRRQGREKEAPLPNAFSALHVGLQLPPSKGFFKCDPPIHLVKNHSSPVLCQAWGAKMSPAYSKWHSKRKAGFPNFHLSLDVFTFTFPPMLIQAAAAWLVHLCSNYRKNPCRRAGVQQPAQGLSLHFSQWKSSSHPSLPCLWSNAKPMPSALVAKKPFPSRCKVGSASWGWGTRFR